MHLKKIAFSVFLLCSFAATVTAQNQTIENGGADELRGIEKIFVDAGVDMSVRDKITAEIRKKLRAVKRELIIVSKPEESDIHLRFHYEVMRDVDSHVGETPASIKHSVALHIANRHLEQFIKSTIDDYVLDVALRSSTVETILREKREAEKRKLEQYDENLRQQLKREWEIEADGLINKISEEIPELLRRNGIPSLLEAKIYLHFYTAVLQEPISPSIFAKEALKRARPEDLQEVFASLFAAVQFLSADSLPA